MHFIVLIVASVAVAIGKLKNTVAMHFIVLIVASVAVAIEGTVIQH